MSTPPASRTGVEGAAGAGRGEKGERGAMARRMMGKRIASSGISLRGWHVEGGVPRRAGGGVRDGEKSRPEGKDYE